MTRSDVQERHERAAFAEYKEMREVSETLGLGMCGSGWDQSEILGGPQCQNRSDDIRCLSMIYDLWYVLWWIMMIYDMIYDELWWFMMSYDDLWIFMMICDCRGKLQQIFRVFIHIFGCCIMTLASLEWPGMVEILHRGATSRQARSCEVAAVQPLMTQWDDGVWWCVIWVCLKMLG